MMNSNVTDEGVVTARLSDNGRIVIPAEIRQKLLSDELIADRREEARRETEEWLG